MVTRGVIKLLRNVDCSLDSLPRTRVLVTREAALRNNNIRTTLTL